MPEGPEVKRNASKLAEAVSNKTLKSVDVVSGRYTRNELIGLDQFSEQLPDKIIGVGVHGKFIYVICKSGFNLWSTLGMTGVWSKNMTVHSRLRLSFEDGTGVFFNDVRNFGTLKFVYGKNALIKKLTSLGPDLLSGDVTYDDFKLSIIRKKKWNICKALMDQKVVAGIGNYIKAECLWLSKVDPSLNVEDLTEDQLKDIYYNAKQIMQTSYDTGGATFKTHKGFDGESGKFQERFMCYGRTKDIDGNLVIKTKTPDGRNTHWAPERQKSGKHV